MLNENKSHAGDGGERIKESPAGIEPASGSADCDDQEIFAITGRTTGSQTPCAGPWSSGFNLLRKPGRHNLLSEDRFPAVADPRVSRISYRGQFRPASHAAFRQNW
jgi:hypothetical protein